MMIIGCDFHPSWQQVSWLDTETGETGERKLVYASGDAKAFYQQLTAPELVGMEATGNSQRFIELVQDFGARDLDRGTAAPPKIKRNADIFRSRSEPRCLRAFAFGNPKLGRGSQFYAVPSVVLGAI